MKTILLSIMILLSCNIYSQNAIDKFESQSKDLSWETFKKTNKIKKVKIRDGGVRRITIDASTIDADYDKITYIFITGRLSHFIIEFKTPQTPKTLSEKYGKYKKLPYGYHWLNKTKTIDILYSENYKNQIMVFFGYKNYENDVNIKYVYRR